MIDADGWTRKSFKWEIEGAKGTRTGKLYELHEQEEAQMRADVKRMARRGDTITITEIPTPGQ